MNCYLWNDVCCFMLAWSHACWKGSAWTRSLFIEFEFHWASELQVQTHIEFKFHAFFEFQLEFCDEFSNGPNIQSILSLFKFALNTNRVGSTSNLSASTCWVFEFRVPCSSTGINTLQAWLVPTGCCDLFSPIKKFSDTKTCIFWCKTTWGTTFTKGVLPLVGEPR